LTSSDTGRADAQEARLAIAQRFHGFLPDDWLAQQSLRHMFSEFKHETCFAVENKYQAFYAKYSTVVDRQFVSGAASFAERLIEDGRSKLPPT